MWKTTSSREILIEQLWLYPVESHQYYYDGYILWFTVCTSQRNPEYDGNLWKKRRFRVFKQNWPCQGFSNIIQEIIEELTCIKTVIMRIDYSFQVGVKTQASYLLKTTLRIVCAYRGLLSRVVVSKGFCTKIWGWIIEGRLDYWGQKIRKGKQSSIHEK